MFANVLIGAMPGQGKTFALRVAAAGRRAGPAACSCGSSSSRAPATCPAVGEGRPTTYGSGADDDTIARVRGRRCARSTGELDRRAKIIAGLPQGHLPGEQGHPGAGRRAGRSGCTRWWSAIDECQELFSHPELRQGGRDAVRGASSSAAGPRDDPAAGHPAPGQGLPAHRGVGERGHPVLPAGDGPGRERHGARHLAYKNGIRATMFTARDKGIGYLVGAADDPQIVRSGYLDGPAADKIADRARALRAAAGTLTGHAAGEQRRPATTSAATTCSPTSCAVLPAGEDKVWSETVVDRLAELRPDVYARAGRSRSSSPPRSSRYGVTTGRRSGARHRTARARTGAASTATTSPKPSPSVTRSGVTAAA